MDSKKMIGKRINSALAKANMKQKDLADILDVKANTISYFCSGTRAPNLEQLVSIAQALGVSTDYLLGLVPEATSDMTAREVIEYTGLSEENVRTLHDMSKRIFDKGISKRDGNTVSFDGNKPFIDCLNDLLEAMYNDRSFLMNHYIRLRRKAMKNETVDFWYVMGDCGGPIPGFEHMEYSDPKMQIGFDNELVEYHCLKIAKAIEDGFLKKYLGTPEDIERFKQDVDDERARLEALRRERNGTH